jgi:hypothetical protein
MAGGHKISEDRVVTYSLAIGLAAGAVCGVIMRSVALGGVIAVVVGLLVGLGMRGILGTTALQGLDRRQRKQVATALRRGEAVADPELAPRLVAYGSAVLSTPGQPKTVWTFAWIAFGLGGLVLAGWLLKVEGGEKYMPFGFILVGAAVALFVTAPLAARSRRMIAQAIQANEQPPEPSGP